MKLRVTRMGALDQRTSLTGKRMADFMTEDEKKLHGKVPAVMEHGAGTGLLSEELQDRRMSLADKPMRDLTAEEAAEPSAPRDKATLKDVDLDLDLKASAPQKGVQKTEHVMENKLLHGRRDVHLVAFSYLTPEWKLATALLREMLTQLHPGLVELSEHVPPEEAYTKVLAACRRSAKKPEIPAGRHESVANTEKRRKVQREGRCQSLVLSQGQYEGQAPFNQRLDALKRLSAMRDGPHVVPVLPQGKAESPAQARRRFEAQACCASAVLPTGPEESGEHFEQRLEAVRLTPTRLSLPAVCTPKVGGPHAEGQLPVAKLVPWPVLPRGKYESDASFDLRLEIAVGCSVPALPQGAEESDADCLARLGRSRGRRT